MLPETKRAAMRCAPVSSPNRALAVRLPGHTATPWWEYSCPVSAEAAALTHAALAMDFEEARFRASRLLVLAARRNASELTKASRRVVGYLGPDGAVPRTGLGRALRDLSSALEALWGDP